MIKQDLIFVNIFDNLFVSFGFLCYHKIMKNKSLSIFGSFFKVLNIFIALIALAGLALFIISQFDIGIDFEPLKFIYIVMYEFLLPFMYLIFGDVASPSATFLISIGVGICVILLILSIIAIIDTSRATSYISHHNKKLSYIWAGIYSVLLACIFGFTLVLTGTQYENISAFLSQDSVSIVEASIVVLRVLIGSALAFVINIAMFITLVACREKGQKRTKEVGGSKIFFYSNQYAENFQDSKLLKNDNSEDKNNSNQDSTESSPKGKELINRIMELNKMLQSGEIDDVEFTRLRQIAIRRYRKWENFLKNLKNLLTGEIF